MAIKSKYIVVDSSALVALINKTDSTHKKAIELLQNISKEKHTGLLHNDVYIETLNAIGKKLDKSLAVVVAKKISKFKWLNFIESTSEIRENGLQKFRKKPKSVSFTDCVVMATADEYKTDLIFGFDKHFKTAGYRRIGIDK